MGSDFLYPTAFMSVPPPCLKGCFLTVALASTWQVL
jgi:hypothetical protein